MIFPDSFDEILSKNLNPPKLKYEVWQCKELISNGGGWYPTICSCYQRHIWYCGEPLAHSKHTRCNICNSNAEFAAPRRKDICGSVMWDFYVHKKTDRKLLCSQPANIIHEHSLTSELGDFYSKNYIQFIYP